MNRILIAISLIINFIFMMLTTLLPILVFNITRSTTDVGGVLTVFMISLLLVRIISLKRYMDPVLAVVAGCILFFCGFLLLFYFQKNLIVFYGGSILFGVSIGLVPPAILTLLTREASESKKNISMYNLIIAFASASAPFVGEVMYKDFTKTLFGFWICSAFAMSVLATYLLFKDKPKNKKIIQVKQEELPIFKDLRSYGQQFLPLLFSSISYGAIVTYLPIYFDEFGYSIGIYYFLFWVAYVAVQYLRSITNRLNANRRRGLLLILAGCASSLLLLSFISNVLIVYFSGFCYGFMYGLIYNVFYMEASNIKDERVKNNTYAIIGLMSYIGVGLAPSLLKPFLFEGVKYIFAFSVIYILLAMIIFTIFRRGTGKE